MASATSTNTLHVASAPPGATSQVEVPVAAVVTAAVALLVWFLTRLWEMIEKRITASKSKRRAITALYAEIDFNTRDFEIFLANPADFDPVIAKVREQLDFIPHITDARHTEIYKSIVSQIGDIGHRHIGDIVYFYGLFEKLQNQVEGIYLPSFVKISANGRESVIREIVETADQCAQVGRRILDEMEMDYPQYRLERTERLPSTIISSDTERAARLGQLKSDLDRINANHR